MEALLKQHGQEIAALEASFDAEEARHTAEIVKKLNEEHMDNVQQSDRALLDKVCLKRFDFGLQRSSECFLLPVKFVQSPLTYQSKRVL